METLWLDLRYGLRVLAKSPGFTSLAVLTLALGIGANTAIFSIANAVLVRPLPYNDGSRLVMVWEDSSAYGFPHDTPAPGNFSEWKAQNQVFEDMAAVANGSFNLTGTGNPEQILGRYVTANLFSVLGVSPSLGRDFRPEDDVPGAPHVAIISFGLWLERFGADPHAVGSEIWLNGNKHILIGVMPRGFQFPERATEMWVPAQLTTEDLANHGSHFLEVVARLKPGVSLAAANANLSAIAQRLTREFPASNAKVGSFAVPLREEFAGAIRSAILVLLGAVGFVLLIACANLANLLLARAAGRRRELAVRLALGASRGRVVRQMLTESILLSAMAGALGFVFAVWGTQFLASLIPAGFAAPLGVGVDWRVLSFMIALSIATGILFGSIPAVRASQVDLVSALKQGGGRRRVGSGLRRLRDTLVVSEVALAIVLLTGAALMIRSFENLYHLDPGFRADHVLVMRTPLPFPKYAKIARRTAFYDQVLYRVGRLPRVVAAGYTTWVPLTNRGGATRITIENQPAPLPGQRLIPNTRVISKDYIRALQMKLIAGRLFDDRDSTGTQPVALINQTMARNFWHGENTLGKRFKVGVASDDSPWITIVGIVGDVHQAGLDVPARPEMYVPYQQLSFFSPEYLTVRTSGDPMALAEAIRQQVWAVDREQPVAGVMPLENIVDGELAPRRMQAALLGGFAGLAMLLASLGIYAVLSFTVTQCTQEIGVRIALGAQSRDVFLMILSHGMNLFLLGTAIGLAGALALSRVLGHLLYRVSATDPVSYLVVTPLLFGVTLLASYIPARRAMKVDPMVALHYE
jgi:putative ABC transport system permease protein